MFRWFPFQVKKKSNFYKNALELYKQEQYDSALFEVEKELDTNNKNNKAWCLKGSILFHKNKINEALRACDIAVNLDENYKKAWILKSKILARQGDPDAAIHACDKAIEKGSNYQEFLQILEIKVNMLYEKRHFDEAIAVCDNIIDVSNQILSTIPLMIGVITADNNKGGHILEVETKGFFCAILKQTWLFKGIIYSNQNKYNEAISACESAIRIDSNFKKAWFLKGYLLREQRKFDEALIAYDKVIEIDDLHKKSWFYKAIIFLFLNQYENGLSACEHAITLCDDYKEAWHLKGIILEKLNNYEKALTAYNKAKNIDNKYVEAWNSYASLLSKSNQYKKALETCDRALELFDKDNKEIWKTKGDIYLDNKKFAKAKECYVRAEEWNKLGNLYAFLGNFSKAVEMYDKNNNWYSKWNKGLMMIFMGYYEEALKYFEKAEEIPALVGEGYVSLFQNEFRHAERCFRRVTESKTSRAARENKFIWQLASIGLEILNYAVEQSSEIEISFNNSTQLEDSIQPTLLYYLKGLCFIAIKMPREAMNCFSTVLHFSPNHPIAKNIVSSLTKNELPMEGIVFNDDIVRDKKIDMMEEALKISQMQQNTLLDENENYKNQLVECKNHISTLRQTLQKIIKKHKLKEEELTNKLNSKRETISYLMQVIEKIKQERKSDNDNKTSFFDSVLQQLPALTSTSTRSRNNTTPFASVVSNNLLRPQSDRQISSGEQKINLSSVLNKK